MKSIPAILLVITSHYLALAQNKDNIYIDVGCNSLGISATYDKKLTRHSDIGLGLNAYDFSGAEYGNLRAACYVDFRRFRVIRRNLLFGFADIGLAMNGGREPDSATMSRAGLYTALGLGYCYQINKKGMGPYLSLGLDGYTESIHYHHLPISSPKKDYAFFDATLLLSVGFKF